MNHLEIYFASVHLYNFVTGFCLEDYIILYEKKILTLIGDLLKNCVKPITMILRDCHRQ